MGEAYLRNLTKIGVNTTQEDIDDDRVDNDYRLRVNHLSVENQTTAYTRLVVGVVVGHTFHQLVEEDAPAAGDVYWHDRPFYVPEGCKVRVRLMGITAADVIQVYINGLLKKVR
jgi:hypothetical protein